MSDIFVALPPHTKDGYVMFAKNSDRPCTEVQEVVYYPQADDLSGKVKCTYIEVEQVSRTRAVILSKPAWMWGAEMGANDLGLCVGCVQVWTKVSGPSDLEQRLIGPDFVRLALERCDSAKNAIETIGQLLDTYGQGGPCCNEDGSEPWASHYSFVTADRQSAWLLETAGKFWAAMEIQGFRNVSSSLSIGTEYSLKSTDLEEEAKDAGFYTDTRFPFNFKAVFSEDNSTSNVPSCRYDAGKAMIDKIASEGPIGLYEMSRLLRDEDSNIAMSGVIATMASQISLLPPSSCTCVPCHWFTATPDPVTSIFKPFMFSPTIHIGDLTVSGQGEDKAHKLFIGQQELHTLLSRDDPKGMMILENLKEMETNCREDVEDMMANFDEEVYTKVSQMFLQMCKLELNFYKM